jgi:hypothetical protein
MATAVENLSKQLKRRRRVASLVVPNEASLSRLVSAIYDGNQRRLVGWETLSEQERPMTRIKKNTDSKWHYPY